MRLSVDVFVSVFFLVFCGIMLQQSFQIRSPGYGTLAPAAWPRAVLIVMLVFSLVYFLKAIREQSIHSLLRAESFWGRYRNPILCFFTYFLFLLVLPYLGTLLGAILLVFTLMSLLGGLTPRTAVVHSVIASSVIGVMWSFFTFGLGVLLPPGEIFYADFWR